MSDFVKEIHNMFDHIWDCEIDHPAYQDTVGELMEAVIQTYEKHKPTLSTNLAEVGKDAISRQAAIDALYSVDEYNSRSVKAIKQLPPAEPDIIYCKDCLKHNKRIGDYVEKSDGTYDWIWKDKACPLAEFRGKAQGHEFDYQFCAFAERRTE